MEERKTIEIGGVKIDVDLRYARRHDTLCIGSKVKLLIKGSTYTESKVVPGAVVGFEPFKDLPTIIVTYLDVQYDKTAVKFAYINEKSNEKFDLVLAVDDDLPLTKADIVEKLDSEIFKHETALKDAKRVKVQFLRHFGRWFEMAAVDKESVDS